ncbi:MAG: LPS assembly lipoprotein LptE [Bdellovibrionota bacterium]
MNQIQRISFSFALLGFLLSSSGCGYTWRNKSNPWKAQKVERVYIKAMINNTLRSGLEVPFTSALIREFSRGPKVRIASNEENSDAVIESSLDAVGSSIGPTTTVDRLSQDPAARAFNDYVIASEYSASATITVSLVRKQDKRVLWTRAFSESKTYPANNRFGLVGSTSALINSSQEQLALNEIAQVLASDAYDTMFEAF